MWVSRGGCGREEGQEAEMGRASVHSECGKLGKRETGRSSTARVQDR